MYEKVLTQYKDNDIIIKSAAVSDYRPKIYSNKKIKKADHDLVLTMERNKDIAYELGKIKEHRILVGFAAETHDLIENAREKMGRKNLDLIVANDLTLEGAGFAGDTNIIKIIDKEGQIKEYPKMTKTQVAEEILNEIKRLI